MTNKKLSLKNKILSEQNIYNSIYCLKSYIFERGLLDTNIIIKDNEGNIIAKNDLELYYLLADKFDTDLIDKVIGLCQEKLRVILDDDKKLFDVYVYFKLKNKDGEKVNYRPIHTARLIDLICMVSILNRLMFEDENKRSLSELSKLLPHNFYGNIPSTNVKYLFEKWQHKYKDYTNDVINHCRKYQKNHQYLSEVCLDIQNFFPSISPEILYDFIVNKLSLTYDKDDTVTLRKSVIKLLYFNIKKENIESWEEIYYPKDFEVPESGLYMNCGVAQGLPQSYFFGNLCMIDISKIIMKENFFDGDAYFYVDDSVIYIKSELQNQDFTNKIRSLNQELESYYTEKIKEINKSSDLKQYIPQNYLSFQQKLNYKIKLHEEGKSVICHIDEADNHLGGMQNIARHTSNTFKFTWNLEDIDDTISLRKLNALNEVITSEIDNIESDESDNSKYASRLKVLRRFKKFFLYHYRLLKIKEEGGPNEEFFNDFKVRFTNGLDQWLKQNEEDIFQSEYRILIQMNGLEDAIKIKDEIVKFDETNSSSTNKNYLYFSKDANCSIEMKSLSEDPYKSLHKWMKLNFIGCSNLKLYDSFENFSKFLFEQEEPIEGNHDSCESYKGYKSQNSLREILQKGFNGKKYTIFIANNSSEFQRVFLNAYFSQMIGVHPSDALSFTKMSCKKIRYTELRVLARLRNKEFDKDEFLDFVRSINPTDVSNNMGIDMGLVEVLKTFIRFVRKPNWIDNLILTHRITKGLWYNGSKFLNAYTLHNEEHAVTLINSSVHIVKTVDYFVLKKVDYYILFLSCYLHDISMVIHPDMHSMMTSDNKITSIVSRLMLSMNEEVKKFFKLEKNNKADSRLKESGKFILDIFNEVFGFFEAEVRDKHASASAKFVRDKSDSLLNYIEPTILEYVSKVSDSHGYDTIDVYGLKSRAKDEKVSLKYLMILLRLADLCDVANDRVNYHLLRENFSHMSLTSRFHWVSHLVTDRIELDARYNTIENKNLDEKPITEILDLNLYLNVKYLTSDKNIKKCKNCKCSLCKEENKINLSITNKASCTEEKCIFLCRWMTAKHNWLIEELKALNEYLFSVNNSLISTQINFNIFYNNDMNLESDMFDDVQLHLSNLN